MFRLLGGTDPVCLTAPEVTSPGGWLYFPLRPPPIPRSTATLHCPVNRSAAPADFWLRPLQGQADEIGSCWQSFVW